MAELPLFSSTRDSGLFNEAMSLYGAPAYVRRSRQTEEAWEGLIEKQRRRREELIAVTRTLVGMLRAQAGAWTALRPWLADDAQVGVLERLEADLQPQLRLPPALTRSPGKLRRALQEVVASVERFNQRWELALAEVEFTAVNELRAGYNRFYVLEKEMALRSPRLARQGFRPLAPASTAELTAALPLLPLPVLAQ
jgi:hypothetical protein